MGIEQSAPLTGHRGGADHLVFAPDDQTLATAGNADRTVRFWNLSSGEQIEVWSDTTGPLDYSPDGRLLAVVDAEGVVRLRDVATGEAVESFSESRADDAIAVDFSPDGSRLAVGSRDTVAKLWHVDR